MYFPYMCACHDFPTAHHTKPIQQPLRQSFNWYAFSQRIAVRFGYLFWKNLSQCVWLDSYDGNSLSLDNLQCMRQRSCLKCHSREPGLDQILRRLWFSCYQMDHWGLKWIDSLTICYAVISVLYRCLWSNGPTHVTSHVSKQCTRTQACQQGSKF